MSAEHFYQDTESRHGQQKSQATSLNSFTESDLRRNQRRYLMVRI